MADLMRSAAVWLQGQRKASLSTTVQYVAGSRGTPTAVAATPGRTVGQMGSNGGDGIALSVQVRDYLIDVAVLAPVLAAVGQTEPKRGHRIVEDDGATFDVSAVAGEDVWRYSDPYRLTYRIHTKRVAPSSH